MSGEHDIRAVDVRVHGDVQAVGYRYSAMRRADELDVSGWGANEPDGTVRAHLEGLGYKVDALLEWMRRGTKWTHVRRVDVAPGAVEGFEGFATR